MVSHKIIIEMLKLYNSMQEISFLKLSPHLFRNEYCTSKYISLGRESIEMLPASVKPHVPIPCVGTADLTKPFLRRTEW